jgi:hypothetical protein
MEQKGMHAEQGLYPPADWVVCASSPGKSHVKLHISPCCGLWLISTMARARWASAEGVGMEGEAPWPALSNGTEAGACPQLQPPPRDTTKL